MKAYLDISQNPGVTLRLDEMRWPEIEAELKRGNRTVLVPTSSTEQHGPSLPLSVDELRADALGNRIADEVGCFVAPTIRPGVSDHHMDFPGTITLLPETFAAVISDYARSLDAHGFEQIAFFTTHGGNTSTLAETVDDIDEGFDANVFVVGDRESFSKVRYGSLEEHGVSPSEAGQHAGAAETSFILETAPHLVDRGELTPGHVGLVDGEEIMKEGLGGITANGILGDQTKSSRAAGRTLIDRCVTYYANELRSEVDVEA